MDFETHIFTAQIHDNDAGDLHDDGAKGGPTHTLKAGIFHRH